MKRLPIEVARRVAREHQLDQVIVLGWSHSDGVAHVVTWGRTVEDSDQAAQGGNRMKAVMGWPPDQCQAEPSRVLMLKARLRELEAEHLREQWTRERPYEDGLYWFLRDGCSMPVLVRVQDGHSDSALRYEDAVEYDGPGWWAGMRKPRPPRVRPRPVRSRRKDCE